MNGIDNQSFADNVKRLQRELAELKEMVRLGAVARALQKGEIMPRRMSGLPR